MAENRLYDMIIEVCLELGLDDFAKDFADDTLQRLQALMEYDPEGWQ